MSPELHHLTVSKSARLATYGNPLTARYVWIALHGYGQLLPYFIRSFQSLPAADHYVVAPEGLSRFYLQGTAGRIGASWMTKEDRLTEIADQIQYLNTVRDWIIRQIGQQPVVWIGFGFSQGVATLNRWLAGQTWAPGHIVNWAGSPPWDINYDQRHLRNAHWWYRLGHADEYINKEDLSVWKADWANSGIVPQIDYFDGTHQILPSPLLALAEAIALP